MAWDWDKLQERKRGASGGAPGAPPGIDEIFDKIKGMKGKFPGGVSIIVIIIILLIFATSSFYTVKLDEAGIVQRFGKYQRTGHPGLNFKYPAGIEKVTIVKVTYIFKEEFGFRTIQPGVRTRYETSSYENESLMLAGDRNVALVPWIVQYRITNPKDYLFKVNNVRATLRDFSESSMRLVIGDRSIDEILSEREEIASAAKVLLQKQLDMVEAGIKITALEMKKTNVPQPVQPSLNEVNQAIQVKEKTIYQAEKAYNKVIPAAKGDAEKTISSAEGYALDRVNRARGDAARFLSLYEEYEKAKEITRRRLYLESMQEILPKIGNKYIVDTEQKNLLPLLNLGKIKGDK
ncbi:MAG: FtsH protease activity modulator HflK [Deltaproteobacteria bacterium]|nr:FtsH protease activity modulator HflK [Deltaproteobacteria bacterium]